MVELGFGGDEAMTCEGCGTELPAFLDECPYCAEKDAEGDDTLPCPECGAEISDLAEQCPSCGAWVTTKVPRKGLSFLTVMAIIMTLLMLLVFAVF